MDSVSPMMRITSRTMPCRPSSFKLLEMSRRSLSVMRLRSTISSIVPKVMNPKPPSWMSRIKMTCPSSVKSRPGSSTESPVTHTAEVAVNSASI